MNDSPRTDLRAFDFDKEEELAQSEIDEKRLAKFKSPILDPQSLANHDAQVGKVDVKNAAIITCVDVVDVSLNLEKGGSDPPLDPVEDVIDCKDKNSELEAAKQSNSINHQNYCRFKIDIHNHNEPEMKDTSGSGSPEASQIDPSGSSSSNESVDVNSEADECMNESAPTSPDSDIAENVSLNGCGLNGSDIFDMDVANAEVVLHPDYVIYQANYYMGPKLTFSSCCMKINASTTCIKQGAFDLEWAVDDLIDIKCQWFQSSGTVIIKLRVISSNASQSNHVSSTSGIEELEIAVVDFNWSLRHKQITSLNMKYMAIWSIVLHTDVDGNGNDSREPRSYFPNFDKPFDEVIYPKGDPDAVSLSKRDVDLLQPDTFINDTIIDFYIQYLKNKIQEEEKPRFHFFNSFFFRKLADMDKNPSSASDGKAAFLRVRKWTRKVNLFEKDYIFIPVNFNLHWSLIVICHPGEVVNFNGKELDKSLKVPCILHMDSIKGSHSGLKNLVQSYLWEEWKERHKDTLEDDRNSKFSTMRFLPLALPQQENSYDCGLFLLHYLELFLAQAPSNFNPFKLTKFSNFLNVDWFLPAEAYLKRTLIQRLIFELVENHGSHEISSSDCSDDDNICIGNNDNRTGIQHPELNRESTNSHTGQGIEITLLSASTSLDPQSFNNSGLVLKELFEPGASAGTLVGQCQSFDQRSADYRFNGSVFSMEEDADLGEQLMYLTSDPNFQQVAGVTPQSCSLPYLSRNCGDDACHRPEISLHAEQNMAESSLDASSGGSDDSEEDIGVVENCPVGNEAGSCDEAELGEINCSPIENPEQLTDISVSDGNNLPVTSVPRISQDLNTECDGNLSDLKVTCDEGQVTDDRVTCDGGQVTEDKVTCDGHVTEDKVTCDDGQVTEDKVTCVTEDKVTCDDGQVTDDKVTCDDGQVTEDKSHTCVTEDKITCDDGQVTDDKVTCDDGQVTDDKVTCDDGQVTEDKITCVTEDKITCGDGQVIDDKVTCDDGRMIDKVTCDDGQMIDGMAPDVCEEEQAAKRRRLMPLQSGSEETLKNSNL